MMRELKKNEEIKKLTYDNYITVIFLSFIGITLLFNVFFQNSNKLFRVIITAMTVIIMRLVFKASFLKKSRASYTASLIFIFLSMYLGNVCNFYSIIHHYDKILHFLSGIIIGIIGLIVYAHFTKQYMKELNPKFIIVFVFIFCVALAGCWEMWEFAGDRLLGFKSQNNSLNDTMMDIICGTVGGVISLIPIYKFINGGNNKFLEKATKEVI